MTPERLQELVGEFQKKRVVVLGDFFLDKYLEYDPDLAEISIETGKTAHQVVHVRHSPGAAGTVVANLAALGAKVVPCGFTGDDGEGYELRLDLRGLGCDLDSLTTAPGRHTPTYLKPRDAQVAGLPGEAERYDTKNRDPLSSELEDWFIDAVDRLASESDAVVIADQVEEVDCGVVTARVRAAIAQASCRHPGTVFFVDSRNRAGLFRGVCLKPNLSEAIRAANCDAATHAADAALRAGRELGRRTGRPVFLTRSEEGILVFDEDEVWEVPAVCVAGPIDPTGAGDSATAGAVLALASGGTAVEAGLVANLAASVTVVQVGVTGVAQPGDLFRRLEDWRSQGKTVRAL